MNILKIIAFSVLCHGTIFAQIALPPGIATKRYEASVSILRTLGKQWQQPVDIFDKKYSIYEFDNVYYCEKYYRISVNDVYSLSILASGQLIEYENELIRRALRHSEAQSVTPTWDSAKAVSIASDFLTQMFGAMPKDLAPGRAQCQMKDNTGHLTDPEWTIDFRRMDQSTGYYFEGNFVSVENSERFGPYQLINRTPARFSGVNFIPAPKIEIIDMAYEMANKLAGWGPIEELFHGGTLLKSEGLATLRIVEPNGFGKENQIAVTSDLNARLAWVVWYPWQPIGRVINPKNPPRALGVWIDAETKAFLGGDCFAH